MAKPLTDKQIAYIYLSGKLQIILDHDELRSIAGVNLSETRCNRIAERLVTEAEKLRRKYVDYLNRDGQDTA